MKTVYATRRCPVCLKGGTIMVDENELFAYLRGEYIGKAFKTLSIPLREQIISGVHPHCWIEMWGEERVNEYASDYSDTTD